MWQVDRNVGAGTLPGAKHLQEKFMTDDRRPTDAEDLISSDPHHKDEASSLDEGRRRFTKAGIATVPVILTLASRPALGGSGYYVGEGEGYGKKGKYQCTVSGGLSGNLSKADGTEECHGCKKEHWTTYRDHWPGGYQCASCKKKTKGGGRHCKGHNYNDDGTQYHKIFKECTAAKHGKKTMIEVMTRADDEPGKYGLAAEACAALLNAAYGEEHGGFNYGYTRADIVALYETYCDSNAYELENTFRWLNDRICLI